MICGDTEVWLWGAKLEAGRSFVGIAQYAGGMRVVTQNVHAVLTKLTSWAYDERKLNPILLRGHGAHRVADTRKTWSSGAPYLGNRCKHGRVRAQFTSVVPDIL